MESKRGWGDVVLMVLLILFAVVLVDERWIRTGITLVPVLLLAQRAAHSRRHAVAEAPRGTVERRIDNETRAHIEELLKHFREFYASVHLMEKGQLSPEEAKGWAAHLERELNALLAQVIEAARRRQEPAQP